MLTGIEVTKAALDDFRKIQEYMLLAKKENAVETYAKLKDEYLTIKALLNVSGVMQIFIKSNNNLIISSD